MKRAKYIFCLFLLLPIFSLTEAYSIFEDNGKVGLKNDSGKILIPAKYEALGWSHGDFSVLNNATGYRSNGKWGLISLANQILTKAEFEEISPAEASLLIVRKKSPATLRITVGAISPLGKEVIPFQYDDIKLSSLRAIVFSKVDTQYKYGLIDLENKVLIPQHFKNILSLGSLRYAVENFDSKWALFTESGKQITNFTMDSILPFQKQYAVFYAGSRQGLLDRDGGIKIEPKHQEIKIKDDGSVYVRQPATWLFLDGQNKLHQKVQADSISEVSKNLLKVNASGNIQLTDYHLKQISTTKIHSLESFINGKAIFSVDDRYGVIRNDGVVVIEPKYTNLRSDNDYFASNIRQGGKDQWILLDSTGKSLHAKTYDNILPYNGKVFPVINRKFWGALAPSGKEILSCTYDSILQQLDDNIVVKFHGQYGIVNQAERWLVAPRSKKILLIAEDRFLEFTPKTTYLKSFDNSIIYFSENKLELQGTHLLEYLPSGTIWEIGMDGVIGDRKILPDMVEKIYPETEGLRGIKKNGQYGFIDSQGRLRIANRYDAIRPFSEQLAAMMIRGKWGFIGHDDKIAVQPSYDEVHDFKHGLAVVKQKGMYGVVDKTGKQVLLPRYEAISVLPHRNILIQQNGLIGLADAQGKVLVNPKFHNLQDLNNGYIIVQRDGKYGAITSQGISTIPLIYDFLSYASSNNIFFAMTRSEWVQAKF
jgi:hypothetical protein